MSQCSNEDQQGYNWRPCSQSEQGNRHVLRASKDPADKVTLLPQCILCLSSTHQSHNTNPPDRLKNLAKLSGWDVELVQSRKARCFLWGKCNAGKAKQTAGIVIPTPSVCSQFPTFSLDECVQCVQLRSHISLSTAVCLLACFYTKNALLLVSSWIFTYIN